MRKYDLLVIEHQQAKKLDTKNHTLPFLFFLSYRMMSKNFDVSPLENMKFL